jgi:hypothetical protein
MHEIPGVGAETPLREVLRRTIEWFQNGNGG